MDKKTKQKIVEYDRHQFIYAKNTMERKHFLESIDDDYKIKTNVNEPMSVYLLADSLFTGEDIVSANGDTIRLQSFAREQLSFIVAVTILKKMKRDIPDDELTALFPTLLDYINRLNLNRQFQPIANIDELISAFQKSADFYRDNFLREQRGEELTKISSLQVPFLDITSFVSKVKKSLKNDSHFALIIDYQSKLSAFSEQAVNNLVGGRINSDISVKLVSEPEDWQVYFDMGGNRIDATHDYETVDLDGSLKRYTEKQKRMFYDEDTSELGGFTEYTSDIDGDEEEFEAFNCCLAQDYVSAMIDEDFESLGEIDDTLLNTIAEWATKYDSDEEQTKRTEEITKGLMITYKDRTFAEAVIENQNADAAFALILNGNHDPRLYMTFILHEDLNEAFGSLLNQIHSSFSSPDVDKYCNFLESIFSQIGDYYDSLETTEQQLELLNKVRPYIAGIRMPICYKDSVRLKSIAAMNCQNWQIQLKKMMKKRD